jgi:hypothetical protein
MTVIEEPRSAKEQSRCATRGSGETERVTHSRTRGHTVDPLPGSRMCSGPGCERIKHGRTGVKLCSSLWAEHKIPSVSIWNFATAVWYVESAYPQ